MNKFKPFLLGCVVGAGCIFVALQYHMVRGHDGIQFVPRTPQHSLGLAYADVRSWDAAQWTDRPELARALVAHGSSDLIASSVADSLADSITSGNSSLDQLRSFINESVAKPGIADDLLHDPIFSPQPGGFGADEASDLLQVPFPDSARQIQPLQRLTTAPATPPSASVARASELSVEDVFSSGVGGLRENLQPEFSQSDAPDESQTSLRQIREETGALEDLLFGGSTSNSAAADDSGQDDSTGLFQDVTSLLDQRATDALARAREGFRDDVASAVDDGTKEVLGYVREQVRDSGPQSLAGMFLESSDEPAADRFAADRFIRQVPPADELPEVLKALRENADPFLNR